MTFTVIAIWVSENVPVEELFWQTGHHLFSRIQFEITQFYNLHKTKSNNFFVALLKYPMARGDTTLKTDFLRNVEFRRSW